MCGRFTLRLPPQNLQSFFDLVRADSYQPRYNIAPTQDIVAIRQDSEGRVGLPMHWGLIPHWAKDRKLATRMINARGESVAEKPSFRMPFRQQRCLIPADGFYEWKDIGEKQKQPFYITLTDEAPFAMAGLWTTWTDPEVADPHASTVTSCTIITTAANSLMGELHHRMPVILTPDAWQIWLSSETLRTPSHLSYLQELLNPYPASEMQFRPVSRLVSNARNETPDCLSPWVGDHDGVDG